MIIWNLKELTSSQENFGQYKLNKILDESGLVDINFIVYRIHGLTFEIV